MSERERERGNAIPILEPTCHPLIHARQHPRTLRRIMSTVLGVLAMPDLVAELAEQACGLPAEDRSRLVDLLLESLHDSPPAEVEAAWAWIDPILEAWRQSGDTPRGYTAGSWGPSAAVALIERDGRTWNEDAG